jgi:glutathione S-transferase
LRRKRQRQEENTVSEIVVWGRRCSFNVQKVLWTLDELSLRYEHRNAGGSFGGLDTPEFLGMNPHGQVPVLKDGSAVIWESNSIVRYLSASYGVGSLWQESPEERSHADRWMDWAATALQPSFMRLFWGYYRTPADRRNHKEIESARAACRKHYRALNAQLSKQRYLAGDQLSMADIPAGTSLHRYFTMGIDVEQPREVMAWFARLQERPAFQTHVMVPFNALFGRLAY